jgi:hypothetical protein
MARFTLEARKWYAAEIFGEEFGENIRSYSPIRIDQITPKGDRRFSIAFYHANYPEGVREKTYDLETIERNANFVLARSVGHKPARIMLFYAVTISWVAQRFNIDLSGVKDVQDWLTRNA